MGSRAEKDVRSSNKAPSTETSECIKEHLQATEKIVRTLRKDLDYYRAQHHAIVKERNELLGLVSRLESVRGEQTGLEGELRFLRNERDKLTDRLRRLEEEKAKWIERCTRLEAELAEERRLHIDAREIIVYLETQIDQLTAMVEMLKEHRRFKREMLE
jgi:chromosome segregation ATPase